MRSLTRVELEQRISAMLHRGISQREAQELYDAVITAHPALDSHARTSLAWIAEQHGHAFTRRAAKKWQELTGIELRRGEVVYPKAFLPTQSLLSLRASLATESRGGSAAPLTQKPKPRSTPGLVVLPGPVLMRVLERGSGATVAAVLAELRAMERTVGNADGVVSPDELTRLPLRLRRIMNRVYRRCGVRRLSLVDIQRALPEAIGSYLSYHPNRQDPAFAAIYRGLVDEAVDVIGRDYQERVLRTDLLSPSAFWRDWGFVQPGTARTLCAYAPKHFPRPDAPRPEPSRRPRETDGRHLGSGGTRSREERQALARIVGRLVRGYLGEDVLLTVQQIMLKLSQEPDVRRYVPRLGRKDVQRLRADFPDLIPKLDGVERWLAILTQDVKGTLASHPAFTQAQVLAALLPKHPKLTISRIETVAARNPGLFTAGGHADLTHEHAREVRQRAAALAAADPFLTMSQLIEVMNRELSLVRRFGALSRFRYNYLKVVARSHGLVFPALREQTAWMAALKPLVEKLLQEDPSRNRKDLLAPVQQRFPSVRQHHLDALAKAFPELVPGSGSAKRQLPIQELARDIARLLRRDPTMTQSELTKALRSDYPGLQRHQVRDTVRRHRTQALPADAHNVYYKTARDSLPVRTLWSVLLRMLPPGTSEDELTMAFNKQLELRGLPAYAQTIKHVEYPKLDDRVTIHAKQTAQIVAEYATQAERGASEDAILEQVLRDYPKLTPIGLGRLRAKWHRRPADYPTLAPFVRRGELRIEGRGERITNPRFLGGWSFERSVMGADREELLALALASQHLLIPLSLPLLDEVVANRASEDWLERSNILWVTHLLADGVPSALTLKNCGALMTQTIVVGTPYGSNGAVQETLKDKGFDVRVPKRSIADYRKVVEQALDEIVAKHRKNGHRVLVMDDGGLVTDLLHTLPKYKDVRQAFRIVEQTTGGMLLAERHKLEAVVVNAARSRSKIAEGKLIGQSVVRKVLQGLERLGTSLVGQRAVIMGYGVVGRAVATQLRAAGCRVTVVEPSTERAALAQNDGHTLATNRNLALSKADIIVGCTGTTSITLEDMQHMKSGVVLGSASSKQVELAMGELQEAASARETGATDEPLLSLPTVKYTLRGKEVIVLGDGFPLNFDGDVVGLPPHEIQLVSALMFLGLCQAGAYKQPVPGIVALDPVADAKLLTRWKQLRMPSPPVFNPHDPTRWPEVVRAFARSLGMTTG